MKKRQIISFIFLVILMAGCGKMEDNYQAYLNDIQIYSPRVSKLTVKTGLREATLNWENPQGNIAVKNAILLQDSLIVLDGLVETYKLTKLKIIGYQISVYTLDKFGNYSVPASISIFPNGE